MHVRRRVATAARPMVVAALPLITAGAAGCGSSPAAAPAAPSRAHAATPASRATAVAVSRVRGAVEDVARAEASRADAKDSSGVNLEGLKAIAAGPGVPGRYLGVYHHRRAGRFVVAVGVSDDLVHWRRVRTLGTQASQATIRRLPGGGFLVAWEQEPRNHVRLAHYATPAALLTGRSDATFDAPLTLSSSAEGTPDIRGAAFGAGPGDSTVQLGLHYLGDGGVDREATATLTDFGTWRARPRPGMDRLLAARGLRGNFGDRDTFALDGRRYEVVEGQARRSDFGSWGTYLREASSGAFVPLRIRAPDGQRSFGNPTVTVLPGPRGGTVLFFTAFAFREGAPRGAGAFLSVVRLR